MLILSTVPTVFDRMCTDNGISFMRDHQQYNYLWDIAIGSYTLTPQLASERGYILTNDSTTLILAVPLFTIGYVYEFKLNHQQGTVAEAALKFSIHCG